MLQIRDTVLAVTGVFLNDGNGSTKNGGTKGATEYTNQKYGDTLRIHTLEHPIGKCPSVAEQ